MFYTKRLSVEGVIMNGQLLRCPQKSEAIGDHPGEVLGPLVIMLSLFRPFGGWLGLNHFHIFFFFVSNPTFQGIGAFKFHLSLSIQRLP